MDWSEYGQLVKNLSYGKKLPGVVYVHRETEVCQTGRLGAIVQRLAELHQVGEDFNVLKFRTDAPRLSFLSYPGFFDEAHPALRRAIAIDLVKGRIYATDYGDNLNPPILHRKERLLSPGHPRVRDFEALTEEEEKVGLYLNTAIIGFRANWEQLLRECGVEIEGHTLKQVAPGRPLAPHSIHRPAVVHRHKTAITRYDLSKPVKTLLEYGQLRNGVSFFDYGCGLGADVRGLKELGYQAAGWDPVHAPNEERTPSEVVNLGYVLNVIENPAERLETLVRAWGLTRRLLVVSALLYASKNTQDGLAFQDGILTTRRTFQKYFTQAELQQYVEDALDVTAVPASLGVFYVFKEATDQQGFLQSRSRRVVDWDSLGLRWERPQKKERTPRVPLLPQRAQARPLHEEPHSHRHRGLLLLPRVP